MGTQFLGAEREIALLLHASTYTRRGKPENGGKSERVVNTWSEEPTFMPFSPSAQEKKISCPSACQPGVS